MLNMKKARFFVGLAMAAASACLPGMAQAEIEWLETEYDFGAFREADGPRTGWARFVNKGSEATFISRVRPSCGCTGASYTHDMIEPGDTATISFTYNPQGRPGRFNKSVRVYVGSDNELMSIRIFGTVIGAESSLKSHFPVEAGPLRLENSLVAAGEVKRGVARHFFLNAYNQSGDTILPSWNDTGNALSVDVKPRAIPPGEIATFSFYLQTGKEEKNGLVEHRVTIKSDNDNPESESTPVDVSAIIVADTDKMSAEEIESGPRAYLLPEFIDLGEPDAHAPAAFRFEILNDGKSAMKVERVYSKDSRVRVKKVPGKIKPGKKARVEGSIDLASLPEGAFRINVEVLTDDALHPVRTASLVGIKGSDKQAEINK